MNAGIPIEHAADPEGDYVMGPASAVVHGDRLTVFATDAARGAVAYKRSRWRAAPAGA